MSDMNGIVNGEVIDKWLPDTGEGDNRATQAATAVAKIIYRWYNDGDVYDNTTGLGEGFNDLSSYANWIYAYVPELRNTLNRVFSIYRDSQYEQILYKISEYFDGEVLEELSKFEKVGSVYTEDGPFAVEDYYDDEEEEEEEEEDW
jgi:hypothetical protein